MAPLGSSQVLSERLREISKQPGVGSVEGLSQELTWAADVAQRYEDANGKYQRSALAIRKHCEAVSEGFYKCEDTGMPTAAMVANTLDLFDRAIANLHTQSFWFRLRKAARLLLGLPW